MTNLSNIPSIENKNDISLGIRMNQVVFILVKFTVWDREADNQQLQYHVTCIH